jgi:hypothetical protein
VYISFKLLKIFSFIVFTYFFFSCVSVHNVFANSRDSLVLDFMQAQQDYEAALEVADAVSISQAYQNWLRSTDRLDKYDRENSEGFWQPSEETLKFHNRFKSSYSQIGKVDLVFRISKYDFVPHFTKDTQVFLSSSSTQNIKDIEVVIFGVVLGLDGKPVDGASIFVNNVFVQTDRDGRYIVRVPSKGQFDVGYQYDFVIERVKKYPKLEIVDKSFDLGVVDVESVVEVSLVLENRGHRELVITSANISGDNDSEFEVFDVPVVLKIGERKDLVIRYAAKTEGDKSITVNFASNDSNSPLQEVDIKVVCRKRLVTFLRERIESSDFSSLVVFFERLKNPV